MRFPFSLTRSMALYMIRKNLLGAKRFPMVLMLEPLHACNLHCDGCGRIREYSETLHQWMSVEDCLTAAKECGAPIVSVCGGEPLLYRELPELLDRLIRLGKHLYLCSNGLLLAEKMVELASIRNRRLRERLYFNIHLDGPARIHDRLTGRPGSFEKGVEGIRKAKEAGFRVYINTTVYHSTTVDDLIELAGLLTDGFVKSGLKPLDGMMISPAYSYESVLKEKKKGTGETSLPLANQGNPQSNPDERLFMTREEIHHFFREVRSRMTRAPLTATPIFMDFLCGERPLHCAAWANPTRNIRGWRSPCYLIADTHYATWRELMTQTDWSKIGPDHDPRCRDCLTHCGYEPAGVLAMKSLPQILRTIRWELSSK